MKLGKLLKIAPCEICLYVSTSNDIFDDDYTEVFVGNYTKVPEHFSLSESSCCWSFA